MTYASQHIPVEKGSNSKEQFFGNAIHVKPFFSPVLQLKPAEEKEDETSALKSPDINLDELKKDFDEARKNLCQLSYEFFKQAVKPGSRINSDTPTVLDTFSDLAATCSSLSAYIKLKPKKIAGTGVYKPYAHNYSDDYTGSREGRDRFDANAWHQAVKQHTSATTRQEIAGVGGFYLRSNDTINMPGDAITGSALHESMHRMSGTRFRSVTRKSEDPDFLSEGATQYFTDKVLADSGIAKVTGHKYGKQVAAIEKLVSKMNGSFDALARLYFQDDMGAFHEILLGLQLAPDIKTNITNPGQQIYDAVKS